MHHRSSTTGSCEVRTDRTVFSVVTGGMCEGEDGSDGRCERGVMGLLVYKQNEKVLRSKPSFYARGKGNEQRSSQVFVCGGPVLYDVLARNEFVNDCSDPGRCVAKRHQESIMGRCASACVLM